MSFNFLFSFQFVCYVLIAFYSLDRPHQGDYMKGCVSLSITFFPSLKLWLKYFFMNLIFLFPLLLLSYPFKNLLFLHVSLIILQYFAMSNPAIDLPGLHSSAWRPGNGCAGQQPPYGLASFKSFFFFKLGFKNWKFNSRCVASRFGSK